MKWRRRLRLEMVGRVPRGWGFFMALQPPFLSSLCQRLVIRHSSLRQFLPWSTQGMYQCSACRCVCVHPCMCVRVCASMHVCAFVCVHTSVHVCVHAHVASFIFPDHMALCLCESNVVEPLVKYSPVLFSLKLLNILGHICSSSDWSVYALFNLWKHTNTESVMYLLTQLRYPVTLSTQF